MDSGNSGSMQSSSCGDEIEEYDSSRPESDQLSMFLNNQLLPSTTTTTTTRSISHFLNPPPQSSSLQQQMFDPLANYYMDSLQKSTPSNQNSFLNLDMMWSKGATGRSEQNNNDLSNLMIPSSSSSSHQNQQAFLLSQVVGETRENINVVGGSVPTTHHSQPLDHHHHRQQRGTSLTNDQQNLQNINNSNMGRNNNPKKRSRASRRAPTTVLTTDTTNFRAMVQEFTGIPAQPFSSPFPRTRLDLFGSSRSSFSSSHMDSLPPPPPLQPPYLLRPFAQKIHSFPPSSSMVENLLVSNNNSTTINYHLSQQHQNQQSHHPVMQHNQILGFQSISETATTKYPIGSHQQQTSLEISPNVDSHIKRGSLFEELSHHVNVNNTNNIGNVLHRQNMVPTSSSSDAVVNNNMGSSSSGNQWGTRTNNGGNLGSLSCIEERNCTSDFGIEKGQECAVATTRGEGTVESWINCSSSD
ncbi:VQ motif protein [Trifolium pratense]|uniref:VQ motif protein n=1 Tax=Trifolium pratense TaxID=57577 RepID=A0A2K3NKB4_TRIPR|nr:VQ motif protein [Trifolium pratense]